MHKAVRLLSSIACLAALSVACNSEVTDKPAAPAPAGKRVDAATAGSIAGQIRFEGTPPAPDLIRMTTDKNCVQDAGPNPQSDALLVADGALKNAFVYVKDGLDAQYTFDTPAKPAVLDQKGCIYTPRVLGLQVGQSIEIVNSDPTLHNVHALPMANAEFNHGQPKQHSRLTKAFTVPEVMVRFKCDVHSWMAAHVGVLPHPFFAVSDAAGAFRIPGLPPGTYTIEAWHEVLGTRTAEVTIGPSQAQTTTLSFTMPARKGA